MRGCKLIYNDIKYHTGNDLGMVQEAKKIGYPEPDTYTVKVPGRNGLLNLSKALTDKIVYSNRDITLRYFIDGTREARDSIAGILSQYHGEEIQIIDDDTPTSSYTGIATVSRSISSTYDTYVISIDAYPFRRALDPTVISKNITTKGIIEFNYVGEPIPFKVTTSANMTVSNGVTSVSLKEAGTYDISGIELKRGINTLTFTGSGTVEISYYREVID